MTPPSSNEANGVKETSDMAPIPTAQTPPERTAPRRHARGRGVATPERRGTPYTWANAFLDVMAICCAVVFGILAYRTLW